MATYATIEDIITVLPNCSGIIEDSAYGSTPNVLIDSCRTMAYNWVNSAIKPYTNTPNTDLSSLTLVESHYASYLIVQGTSSVGDDSTLAYADRFRTEAKRLIDEAEYPATYSTPAEASGFVGTGQVFVTVYDEFTPSATWEARYQLNNQFTIWNTKDGNLGTYNISNDSQFPNPSDTTTASDDAVKGITLNIVTGDTAFAKNDTWRWKTWSSTRKRRGIKFRRLGRG